MLGPQNFYAINTGFYSQDGLDFMNRYKKKCIWNLCPSPANFNTKKLKTPWP